MHGIDTQKNDFNKFNAGVFNIYIMKSFLQNQQFYESMLCSNRLCFKNQDQVNKNNILTLIWSNEKQNENMKTNGTNAQIKYFRQQDIYIYIYIIIRMRMIQHK